MNQKAVEGSGNNLFFSTNAKANGKGSKETYSNSHFVG
jgi:hypothetical protein